VLVFRERSPAAEKDSLPLLRARDLLVGIRRTLLDAAGDVLNPGAGSGRLESTQAEQFLSRCRFEQTQPGGFAMVVSCPLDALPGHTGIDGEPFTRQVTRLLIASLQALVKTRKAPGPLRARTEPPVSVSLCESLLDLRPEDDDAVVEITARWAWKWPVQGETEFQIVRLHTQQRPAA
jgi:hypothetical protein